MVTMNYFCCILEYFIYYAIHSKCMKSNHGQTCKGCSTCSVFLYEIYLGCSEGLSILVCKEKLYPHSCYTPTLTSRGNSSLQCVHMQSFSKYIHKDLPFEGKMPLNTIQHSFVIKFCSQNRIFSESNS